MRPRVEYALRFFDGVSVRRYCRQIEVIHTPVSHVLQPIRVLIIRGSLIRDLVNHLSVGTRVACHVIGLRDSGQQNTELAMFRDVFLPLGGLSKRRNSKSKAQQGAGEESATRCRSLSHSFCSYWLPVQRWGDHRVYEKRSGYLKGT